MSNTYEQEIDLKDLIFFIVKKWRSIILIVFIFATLIGGYKLSKGVLNSHDKQYIAELLKTFDFNYKNYQMMKEGYVRKIEALSQEIAYEDAYEKNSVLFHLDPYNKWVATTDMYIKINEEKDVINMVDPADSLVKAYSTIIQSKSSLEEVYKENEIEIRYLRELLSIETDYNGNMISLSVTYKDREGAQRILERILESVKFSQNYVESNLIEHSIIFMNSEESVVADQALAERQNKRMESLSEMHKSLEETQLALDNLKEPQTPTDLSFKELFKSAFKYSFMGGALGVFLVGFFLCVIYVTDPKLRSADEFMSRFGIKILGAYNKEEKKNKFTGIDNWINRIEGNKKNSREDVLKRIIANISIYVEKDQMVLLTGTVEPDILKNIESELKDNFNKLTFEAGSDMNRNPETLTRLPYINSVILVERCGVSKYKDIKSQIETINNLDKKIIGCILL